MEIKQVIIQNKEEERQFLQQAKKFGWKWINGNDPLENAPSEFSYFTGFPYLIELEDFDISWTTEMIPRITLTQFLESVDN